MRFDVVGYVPAYFADLTDCKLCGDGGKIKKMQSREAFYSTFQSLCMHRRTFVMITALCLMCENWWTKGVKKGRGQCREAM